MKSESFSTGLNGVKHYGNYRALVLDAEGYAGTILLSELPLGVIKACYGLMIVETGEVIKKPTAHDFPNVALPAQVIKARSLFGIASAGREKALIWTIGIRNDYGFSLPSTQVIDSFYEVIDPRLEYA
jgi:hypothetical protein